ncbi:MAG TPA: glycosyltransferase family 2 protein, partial [Xanthobacteraceae bacterium]
MEPLALSEELHAESLERLCVAALGRGDAAAAFRFVDRRCRIPPLAKAHHFALRAEALNRMGERDSALADLAEAIAIAPDDIHANRRMLAWGKGAARAEAARVLVGQDADPAVIVEALKVLRQEDQRAVASLRVFDEAIAGWVAWNGSGAVALSVLSGARERSYPIAPQDDHPLAAGGFEHIASFEVDRPGSALAQSILLSLDGEPFHAVRAPANRKAERARPRAAAKADAITVIVPIYRDFAATRDCLESLKPEIARRSRDQAILVNDATPEPEIRQYLATFSQVPRFTVLANEVNCGFVASVNRALERTRGGDVVLLNADTIVPPQFIDRLAAIARSHAAIGTVTPLSNNGEFTSFPVPFRQNPVPAKKAARALDRLAARVNEGVAIDIPNGIGFCLYITRACLNAVGPLSEIFQRGYLEDVDFCLRARERGFRNVCAPSVYVSHVGSLSFGADKRSLVVQNLNTIEIKFPDYRTECAAFMAADPLRAARAAIERAMPPAAAFERLIVTGSGLVRAVVDHRADDLQRRKKSVLILSVESGTATVHLHNAAKAVPQSVSFDLAQSAEVQALRKYLTRLKLERIEIADPANVPQSLLALVAGLERPIDLFVADGGLMCPRGTLRRAGAICPRLAARVACEECA